jgi:hypothetical protein
MVSGVTFVIGVANAFSTLLFQRHLKFKKIAPLDVKIGLGSPLRKSIEFQFDYSPIKDDAWIKWRLKNPQKKYFFGESSGGLSIFTNTFKYSIFAEMMWIPKIQLDQFFFVKENLNSIQHLRNPFNLWIGLDSRFHFPIYRYFDVPNKFKPSPLNLIFLDFLSGDLDLNKEKIEFSLLDFDAY